MSKITRNIDTSDRLMLRTSQLKECQEELQSLRSWKEKARPFLENYSFYLSMNDNIESLRLERTTLTELLGGSDEN